MRSRLIPAFVLCLAALALGADPCRAQYDSSAPVILQDFENSYKTIENRMPDIFKAGYGAVYTPPPGRADQGNLSVGYDQYDRFDLGKPGNPTLYGTETGLKAMVNEVHKMGGNYYVDFVMNHAGYSNLSSKDGNGNSFYDAGGYPGFALTLPNDVDGDFHSAYDYSTINERLAGLLDIAQEKNYQFIRNPVDPNDSRNIRPGTKYAFGRIANVADPNNARFYPDTSLQPIIIYDPKTGEQNIKVYPFNLGNPLHGTPTPENGMGYIMRNAQWLVQTIGVDGFRLDAAKHVEGFTLDYFDRAVYRSSFRTLLNGQQQQIFSFSEVYDGDQNYLQTFVQKTINPNDPGRIGGNRDTLDFPLFFALRDNLTGNGYQNSWFNIRSASLDMHDDGLHNGSQGVTFVSSHDNGGPSIGNVAYAYTLMMPGNTIVYTNGHEFGNNRDFPQDGRGDALGGTYGNTIPTLVDLRNRYGRGNYIERWVEQHNFAFERQGSCLVLLNSEPAQGGYDSRTLQTSFAPGTPLIEVTGNAGDANADPFNDIPKLLVVNGDGTVNVRFLHNVSPGYNRYTGNGYLVYGLPTPQGQMSLTNVDHVMAGHTPDPNNSPNLPYDNGTTRLSNVSVIRGDSFNVKLLTNQVNLLGFYRDHPADGDNALIKIDGGVDLNGNGVVDYTDPSNIAYGFERFTTIHNPGYFAADGNGSYLQTIDASKLSDGYHYVEVRAFRHRDDGGPPVYSDWKEVVYVDRNKPNSAVDSFNGMNGSNENRQLVVRSVDQTADSVHTFLNLPAGLSDAQILSMVNGFNAAGAIDRDLFAYGYNGVPNGNNVMTVVTYRPTGSYGIQRFPGLRTQTLVGRGLGDTNFSGTFEPSDVNTFEGVLWSQNQQFNPAADLNGDGRVDNKDLYLLRATLAAAGADGATLTEARNALYRRGDFNHDGVTNAADIDQLYANLGSHDWLYDLNVHGTADASDLATMVHTLLGSQFGDANLDGKVDISDLGILAQHWSQHFSGAAWENGDFNGDGVVDVSDLGLLAQYWNFGNDPALATSLSAAMNEFPTFVGQAVPEPASAGLVVLAALPLLTRRPRAARDGAGKAPRRAASSPEAVTGKDC